MAQKKSRLTQEGVEKIKHPKAGRAEYWDDLLPGFGLRVGTRKKTYVVMTRVAGTQIRKTVGHHVLDSLGTPVLSLKDARDKARAIIEDAASGIVRDCSPAQIIAMTFGDLAANYIEKECPKLARGHEIQSIIERELLPHWKTWRVSDIRKRHARERIEALVEDGKRGAAQKLEVYIKRLFSWAINYYDEDELGIEVSPLAGMKPLVSGQKRQRILTNDELRAIWKGALQTPFAYGPFIRLLLMLGQRKNEVAGMCWSEIDENWNWTVQADAEGRSKSSRAQLLTLPRQAIVLLRDLPRFEGCDFVFPARKLGKICDKHFYASTNSKKAFDKRCGVEGWVLHDFRRVVKSNMARLKIRQEVSERILNHSTDELDETYNLYDYKEEKTQALQIWADELMAIVSPDAVEAIRHG